MTRFPDEAEMRDARTAFLTAATWHGDLRDAESILTPRCRRPPA